MSESPTNTAAAIPIMAARLGYAGLLPFVIGAGLCFLPDGDWRAFGMRQLLAWAAIILSFMGAVHWGIALRESDHAPRLYVASVLPALVAWIALSLSALPALSLIATAFTVLFVFDLRSAREGLLPAWYPRLRMPLTAIVLICLGLAAASVGAP